MIHFPNVNKEKLDELRKESNEKIKAERVMTSSYLYLVDLAGSERVKKTWSRGITLKEAIYINRSFTFLEQVVFALTERKGRANDHVIIDKVN